jgi:WD40 repeat protein
VWDLRTRKFVHSFEHQYQILSVCFDDLSGKVFAGSLDNTVRVYDNHMRGEGELYVLTGHTDSICSLDISPDGEKLLTNAFDNSLKIWDVRALELVSSLFFFLFNYILFNFVFLTSFLHLPVCSKKQTGPTICGGGSEPGDRDASGSGEQRGTGPDSGEVVTRRSLDW